MTEGYMARIAHAVSSSVDPSSRVIDVEEFMKTHGHPPFPEAWRIYKQKGHSVESYVGALRHFYTMLNGMDVLFDDICKCAIYTTIPTNLLVSDMEDQCFDDKALSKGEQCPLSTEQQQGLNGDDKVAVTGLLLHTMSDCYFMKKRTIDKIREIQRMHERFAEISRADIGKLETSIEDGNDEIWQELNHLLSQRSEKELAKAFRMLYIGKWKLRAEFSEKFEDMDELTKTYFALTKASEDKNNLLSNELKRKASKCSDLEKRRKELDESCSRYKREAESRKKVYEKSEKNLREYKTANEKLLKENESFRTKNLEIQNDRARMQTVISHLEKENEGLRSLHKDVLDENSQYKTDIKTMGDAFMRLQAENTTLTNEIDELKAKQEKLLTRLSEVAGAKLTHDNVEITDLSDPNRPMKLGEKFRETYDNEWTEALEELKDVGVPSRAALDFLLDVIMKSFRFCSETLNKQAANCLRCFEEFPVPDSEDLKATKDCVPFLMVVLEGNMKSDIDRMRKNVLKRMRGKPRERYLANIEVHLQKTLNQDNDMSSKTNENSIQIVKGANEEAFAETNTSNPEGEGTINNLQENERSETLLQPERGGKNTEPMGVAQEHTQSQSSPSTSFQSRETISAPDLQSQLSVKNHVVKSNNSKNEIEDTVNISQAGDRNEAQTDSSLGPQGNVPSIQTPYARNVQTGSSGNKQNQIIQTGDEVTHEDRKTSEKSMKESFPMVYKYSWKCFDLCWLMRNHSPGLHLDDEVEQGSVFDPNRFKHYTQTGKHVDFLVWPALYVQKGGPLITKGVAQPVKESINRNKKDRE